MGKFEVRMKETEVRISDRKTEQQRVNRLKEKNEQSHKERREYNKRNVHVFRVPEGEKQTCMAEKLLKILAESFLNVAEIETQRSNKLKETETG